MRLVWSEPAVAALAAIRDYIGRDNPFYAGVFVERLILTAESLRELPARGRMVPESTREDVRELLFQRYRIIYRLRTDGVEILAIVHGARDLTNVPRPPWDAG
ncbi:MAG: type II toxin-antitoxin system RelE/ParE family toxin [Xanthomonadaceae bacterium]|nr:type II toxin-antitoxin system RelE/ParE family toxin [Xanthomonadaceae bacterium]MDP2186807.1 type II toxin-antitoxin system RelE/ParE family toxin [Xanthomonadales bacterium]MDZ4117524.1 type II toxin-antitoxin system RelE/ParE family toxin [Xanthomonadaceae bacterium]